MAEYKDDMFIVINRKHIDELLGTAERARIISALERFHFDYKFHTGKELDQKYYVCNQDEPYANQVIKIILDGENLKED